MLNTTDITRVYLRHNLQTNALGFDGYVSDFDYHSVCNIGGTKLAALLVKSAVWGLKDLDYRDEKDLV